MALSLQFPLAPILPKTSVRSKSPPVGHHISSNLKRTLAATSNLRKNQKSVLVRATEESESVNEPASGAGESGAKLSELGSEIKKVLKERKEEEEKKEGDLLSGVAEEIREIEWPAFGKVLGTTGVVLGVIAGSSVVLLTVNFVLAELSDRVFAGRGIQDFFG
ncbi:hypothetical protein ACOSP7_007649 [Xanthoceras sorbifolium]|uniref:Preprotein translocase subunit SECE1 n=1 Tax=Xanthoceras sorbifolium TaxID=99658 RepID=A0ABQ8IAX4_9ROSI|nr:hypothetical protein JRO89_XS03G0206900 [Xanthoceras sorbifolium]